jgi:hypothetical protein
MDPRKVFRFEGRNNMYYVSDKQQIKYKLSRCEEIKGVLYIMFIALFRKFERNNCIFIAIYKCTNVLIMG